MYIIGIAGGTGSGKSTFTNRLKKKYGTDITILYHDNYYKAQDHMSIEQRSRTNYDEPCALDTELLVEHLYALSRGREVNVPIYNFAIHTRSLETCTIKPTKVIIVEGILVLEDKRLRDMMDMKVYVDCDADERILRRTVRDIRERGRDLEGVMNQYLESVKPMHYLYVEPTRAYADIIINSGMNEVAFDLVSSKINAVITGDK